MEEKDAGECIQRMHKDIKAEEKGNRPRNENTTKRRAMRLAGKSMWFKRDGKNKEKEGKRRWKTKKGKKESTETETVLFVP